MARLLTNLKMSSTNIFVAKAAVGLSEVVPDTRTHTHTHTHTHAHTHTHVCVCVCGCVCVVSHQRIREHVCVQQR